MKYTNVGQLNLLQQLNFKYILFLLLSHSIWEEYWLWFACWQQSYDIYAFQVTSNFSMTITGQGFPSFLHPYSLSCLLLILFASFNVLVMTTQEFVFQGVQGIIKLNMPMITYIDVTANIISTDQWISSLCYFSSQEKVLLQIADNMAAGIQNLFKMD